jgi:CelD/BcsL family acetyltransferase involved in cellulose biosynthesis
VRRLAFVADVHTPMFDVLAADRKEEAFSVLVEKLAADRNRWDVAQLSQIPLESPTLEMLPRLAREAGLEAGIWSAPAAPYISMTGGWDRYLASLSSGHRGNLRNRRRRLEAMGPVAMETVSEGDLVTALDDGFRIEAAAWKGANSTAISSQPDVAKFYRRLAERASKLGWLDLKFLTVGGRRAAFGYSLLFKKRLFVLKEGYDPLYADGSPFLLLFGMMLEDAHRRGLDSVELLGEEEPWKARWTSTAREHRWLFLFGDRHRARLLHALKFGVLPRLRPSRVEAAI